MKTSAINAELVDDSVLLYLDDGSQYELPNLWLRDNCLCDDCRVVQTQEKRFMLSDVDVHLAPQEVSLAQDILCIIWPDHHQSLFSVTGIQSLLEPPEQQYKLWSKGFVPEPFGWDLFLNNSTVAIEALESFMQFGVILLKQVPRDPATLEQLAPMIGPIRELLFDRIHNVSVQGHVYNIAHTSLGLPPHNDFASYSFPPSVQALHMLHNEVAGGDSIVVDGWAILEQLRSDHADYFQILCDFPVAFRQFDDSNETYAVAPMVRCDNMGNIVSLRFSNQLMQMMSPLQSGIKEFYRAYHELCVRIADSKQDYRSTFRLQGGEIILVAAHRVLHARESFQPTAKRHLQDAYFELDNIANKLVLLKRQRDSKND
jgi:gamma-butyrobetaine dioxygenase